MEKPADPAHSAPGAGLVRRHRLPVRLWHWLNALCVILLFMSGLNIFNAHPRLYWGEFGANADAAWLDLTRGDGAAAMPGWLTIPSSYSLSRARIWHLALAWPLAAGLTLYLGWALASGELRRRLHIRRAEWAPRHLAREIIDHARLRLPTGEAAANYNTLQKLAYGGVIFGLLPLMIATGLAMSPAMDAGWPWLTLWLGGRQTARSVHFICAWGLAAFLALHLAMVLIAGPVNELRGMVTGWYRLPRARGGEEADG